MQNPTSNVSFDNIDPNKLSKLDELKAYVVAWHNYFKDNNDRFHAQRRFVFKSSFNDQQKMELEKLDRLPFEFNVLEAYLSRQVGEFAKQEPGFTVQQMPDSQKNNPQLPEIIEGHFKAILYKTKKDQFEEMTFSDIQSGGFSAFKVDHEYSSPYTFNQEITWRKCVDPTMCGWDVLARLPHKGDGDICFELVPMTKKMLKEQFPKANINNITYRTLGGFNWGYKYGSEDIILVCRMYQKQKKKKWLLFLADNTAMLEADYAELLVRYADENRTEQPPIVKWRRKTTITKIKEYKFMATDILEENDTIFTELPIIFVNGNSKLLRDGGEGSEMIEFTRAAFYQAMDAQKLKNIAGQALANELEMLVQHKFIAPLEGIPEQAGYIEAYKKPQKAATLIYRAFKEDGITQIEPPREIVRPPIPPEVAGTFTQTDQNIQNILGAYNPQPEMPNQLSGAAIAQAAIQSSASEMPYINNYLASLNQAAKLSLDMFPKIYYNARSIMIIDKEQKQTWVPINGFAGSDLSMKYKDSSMDVTIEAGVNFEVQKQFAVQNMIQVAQVVPAFAQLLNTAGLTVLLDNLDFRGADQLRTMAEQMQKQAQQKQASQPQPPDPNTLKQMDIQMRAQTAQQELQQKSQVDQGKLQIEAGKLALQREELQVDKLRIALEAEKAKVQATIDTQRDQTDKQIENAKLHLDARDIAHKHAVETHKQHIDEKRMHHEHAMSEREQDHAEKAEKAEKGEKHK
jgi:hypothetical protein